MKQVATSLARRRTKAVAAGRVEKFYTLVCRRGGVFELTRYDHCALRGSMVGEPQSVDRWTFRSAREAIAALAAAMGVKS